MGCDRGSRLATLAGGGTRYVLRRHLPPRMSLPVLAFTREECKSLYDAYMACNHDKPFVARAFGVCEESKFLLDKCLRAEVRHANPHRGRGLCRS